MSPADFLPPGNGEPNFAGEKTAKIPQTAPHSQSTNIGHNEPIFLNDGQSSKSKKKERESALFGQLSPVLGLTKIDLIRHN